MIMPPPSLKAWIAARGIAEAEIYEISEPAIQLACCHLVFITALKRLNGIPDGVTPITQALLYSLAPVVDSVHIGLTRKVAWICRDERIDPRDYQRAMHEARSYPHEQRVDKAIDSPHFKTFLDDILDLIRKNYKDRNFDDIVSPSSIIVTESHSVTRKPKIDLEAIGNLTEELANLIVTQSVMDV